MMKYYLKKYYILLVFSIILISCSHKKTLNDAVNILKNENPINRTLVKYEYKDGILKEVELYIDSKRDTVFNQIKIFKDGLIDTLNSNFYDLTLISKGNGKYKGNIVFHSGSDSLLSKHNVTRELEFQFAQVIGDSLYFKTYKIKDGNEIKFDYTDFVNETVMGYLFQVIKVYQDSIPNKERMVNLILNTTLVDNKIETINPMFELK